MDQGRLFSLEDDAAYVVNDGFGYAGCDVRVKDQLGPVIRYRQFKRRLTRTTRKQDPQRVGRIASMEHQVPGVEIEKVVPVYASDSIERQARMGLAVGSQLTYEDHGFQAVVAESAGDSLYLGQDVDLIAQRTVLVDSQQDFWLELCEADSGRQSRSPRRVPGRDAPG